MDTVGKIAYILKETNKTQKQLTDYLGVSRAIFNQWKTGENQSYKKHISKIAEFLNVSTDYLLGNEQNKKPLSKDKGSEISEAVLKMADRFDKLSADRQQDVLNYIDFLVQQEKAQQEKD